MIIAPATRADGARRIVERMSDIVAREPLDHGEPVRLAGGYYAVDDFANAVVDAEEMVLRAAAALRHGRDTIAEPAIVSFDEHQPHRLAVTLAIIGDAPSSSCASIAYSSR